MKESLRQKTGFVELGFEREGALTLGDRQNVAGGSETARALLAAAVSGVNLYELESHENSPEIAFAQIQESTDRLGDTRGQRTMIHLVAFDFFDFSGMAGPREAKASFDIGIALLHELAHGVLKLRDPPGETDQIGECDEHINQLRRELQLPERLYYHPGITVVELRGSRIVSARLAFVKRTTVNAKPSAKYFLTWLPGKVSPKARNIAGIQQGLLRARRR
jgi:hypothetical protein